MQHLTRAQRRQAARAAKQPFQPIVNTPARPAEWNYPTNPPTEHDAAKKGEQGLNCNRIDCQKPGAVYFNKGTRRWYCRDCARRINEANNCEVPDLCEVDPEAVEIAKTTYLPLGPERLTWERSR